VLANVALLGALGAWCSTTPFPEGTFFATIFPLDGGFLPQTIVGDRVKPTTPPVPDEMKPLPRPVKELFLTLSGTGDKMPANGLGMCCRPNAYDDESVRRTVLWYLLQGGRHIDTAMLYLNHKPIGRAIEEAITRGVPRAEIFVVTKIYDRPYSKGKEVIDALLLEFARDLRVDYLDMVLLHVPKPFVPIGHTCTDWAVCRADAWKALAAAKKRGIVRNIGLSNFDIRQMEAIAALPESKDAPIAANQMMLSPFAPSSAFEIASWCQKNGIAVVAHSPLSGIQHGKALTHQTISAISAKHASLRTQTQVILKWALQKGFCVIPGTGNPEHMRSNLEMYDAEMSAADLATIDGLRDDAGFFYMSMSDDEKAPVAGNKDEA
jgi:diketogulonate reductase-like aldo/keto reductase